MLYCNGRSLLPSLDTVIHANPLLQRAAHNLSTVEQNAFAANLRHQVIMSSHVCCDVLLWLCCV